MEKLDQLRRTDFHVHYTDLTATGIIDNAKATGLTTIALVGRAEVSEHIEDFINYGKSVGVEVLPGVEYLAKVGEMGFVDLIAIGFDYNHPEVRKYFGKDVEKQIKLNVQVARHQKEFLESKGFTFANASEEQKELLEDLLNGRIAEKAIRFCELVALDPNNQEKIKLFQEDRKEDWNSVLEKYSGKPGYKDSRHLQAKFLWSLFFAPGKEGYVPVLTDAFEIIEAVHKANGVVLYSPEGKFNENIWLKLKEDKIDGIMGWHAKGMEISKEVVRDIRRKGMLILGGSDYNPIKNHWQPGIGAGQMYISIRRLEELKQYMKKVR